MYFHIYFNLQLSIMVNSLILFSVIYYLHLVRLQLVFGMDNGHFPDPSISQKLYYTCNVCTRLNSPSTILGGAIITLYSLFILIFVNHFFSFLSVDMYDIQRWYLVALPIREQTRIFLIEILFELLAVIYFVHTKESALLDKYLT